MVTRRQVAERANVSEATVSNVINGKACVSEDKTRRVMEAITALNYVPDQNARTLVMGKSRHIGIAIYETTNPYHMELARHIESHATKKGYIVSLFMLDNNMKNKLDVIVQHRLDGIINFMTNQYPDSFIDWLAHYGAVMINFNGEVGSLFENDYTDAMNELLQKVYELGHRKIAYISNADEEGFYADSRGKAWKTMAESGKFEKTEVFYNHDFELRSDEIGRELCHKLIRDYPDATAIFCTNDLCAMGVLCTLKDAGIRVPQDISVIGCDDIDQGKLYVPSLTTITIDKRKQGEEIAEQVIGEIEGKRSRVYKIYPAHAVYRESLAERR